MKIGNLEVYGIIYKIENLVNDKVYIGQTIKEKGFNGRYDRKGIGIERVYNSHKSHKIFNTYCNEHLLRSIERYGFEAFKVVEVFDIAFSQDELNIKEKCWIQYYNSCNPKYGYNKSFGGEGGKPNEETLKKLSGENNHMYGKKGELAPWYGKHHSKETKLKMSNSAKGKVFSEETREKMSISAKNKIITEETRIKLGKIRTGKGNPRATEVICITTGKIFETIKEASEFYNVNKGHISSCCKGKNKSCGKLEDGTKLEWKHIKDLTTEEYIKYDIENKLKKLNIGDDI